MSKRKKSKAVPIVAVLTILIAALAVLCFLINPLVIQPKKDAIAKANADAKAAVEERNPAEKSFSILIYAFSDISYIIGINRKQTIKHEVTNMANQQNTNSNDELAFLDILDEAPAAPVQVPEVETETKTDFAEVTETVKDM